MSVTTPENGENLRAVVREKYGAAALRVNSGGSSCCGASTASGCGPDPITSNHYVGDEASQVPLRRWPHRSDAATRRPSPNCAPARPCSTSGPAAASTCCSLRGASGSTGKAYGLDMTDEMLALARENQQKSGLTNVEFLKGEIERIPLPDNSVDVIISNCVINLSADKDRVLAEAFRVLKPGGRFAVSDVVVRGPVPAAIRRNVELWIGCVAGALDEGDYRSKLAAAGFEDIEIEPTRIYQSADALSFFEGTDIDPDEVAAAVDGKFMSAFVRGRKPRES